MEEGTRRYKVVVPTRQVQGGLAFKFETDSYSVKLHGILTPQEYTDIIREVNEKTKPARANQLDGALLMAGPLLVPLALWGLRHSFKTKKRKRLLRKAMEEFNDLHPELLMRWNRGGPESRLTIERRPTESPSAVAVAVVGGVARQAEPLNRNHCGRTVVGVAIAEATMVV